MGSSNSTPKARKGSSVRKVTVCTGQLPGSGTDSQVHFIFYNQNGDKIEHVTPNKLLRNDFERGDIQTYPVTTTDDFGLVTKIELWCDAWLTDKWYVDYIKVGGDETSDASWFPIQRWVDSKHLVIYQNDSCLPQFAPNTTERRKELERKKVKYDFHVPIEQLPSSLAKLPQSSAFTIPYITYILKVKIKAELSKVFNSLKSSKWNSLDDVKSIFGGTLKIPIDFDLWKQEWYFGAQRLMGCNPMQIRLCTKIPKKLGIDKKKLSTLMENLSVRDVISQKRLFIVDLKMLRNLPRGDSEQVVCAPIALFFLTKDKTLLPIAIQLFQQKRDDNPVFMPTDPKYTWLVAKLFFNNADAQVHEAISHLLYTHLTMESFCLSAHRQLSQSHPMFRLMAAHFEFLLPMNSDGLPILMEPDGWLDEISSMGREGGLEIIRRKWKDWRFDIQGTFPNELKERGVDDPDVLPNYYYRDDALLIYHAIHDYVSKITNVHYDEPSKITDDHELQSWGKELATPQPLGFGIKGMPGDGHFKTVEDVTQVITSVIFSCSVIHAAVNFNQYDQYANPLKYPIYLRGHPPKDKKPLTEEDVLSCLPDKGKQLRILVMAKLLSKMGTDKLGYFSSLYQSDDASQTAIKEFQDELKKIGEIIDERNKSRMVSYNYLHPSVVPNAISI